jgi:hypothetical protein
MEIVEKIKYLHLIKYFRRKAHNKKFINLLEQT